MTKNTRRFVALVAAFHLLPTHCRAFGIPFASTVGSGANSNANGNADANVKAVVNVNFEDWISDAPDEVKEWNSLVVNGKIPDYVEGTWVRNGGGVWTAGGNEKENEKENENENGGGESFSHVFDGIAKISAYRFRDGGVAHQARFLEGSWYRKFVSNSNRDSNNKSNSNKSNSHQKRLPAGLGTGPVLDASGTPRTGPLRLAQAIWNVVTAFDNAPVNIWDYDPTNRNRNGNGNGNDNGNNSGNVNNSGKILTALTDAPPRVSIDADTMETVSSSRLNPLAKGFGGYELLTTAHPLYALDSDHTYNLAVELGFPGARVNLVKESPRGDRTVVGSFAVGDGVPYFHSFGLTRHYAIAVVQPLRIDAGNPSAILEKGFLRSMKHVARKSTRVVVLSLENGECVLDQTIDDPLYFYHTISAAELDGNGNDNGNDKHNDKHNRGTVLSLRVCAYETPDQITGENQFLRLERCKRGREWRNKLHPGGRFCDVVCDLRLQSVALEWFDQGSMGNQGFELPITRYSRAHGGSSHSGGSGGGSGSATANKSTKPWPAPIDAHPRYVYSFGAYALGSEDFDAYGLFKFDTETKTIAAHYRAESVYLSEPVFVPDPEGTAEDDGVLLCQAYFGAEDVRETKLLVLDARTMDVVAEAGTGTRVPMDFHGAWIPSDSESNRIESNRLETKRRDSTRIP